MKTGKLSETILKRFVLGQIKQHREEVLKGAGVGEDCAFLALQSRRDAFDREVGAAVTAVSTQTVAFPVRNAAYLAVMAAANNVAAGGGRPVSVMLSVTLPEETEESQLKTLVGEAERCCRDLKIQIAGGHTEVSGNVKCPVVTATVIGTADRLSEQMPEAGESHPRRDIVMSKWISLEGTCILAKEKEKELLERYPVRLVNEAKAQEKYLSVAIEAETALSFGVFAMHDVRYGGVFGALWELSQKTGMGFDVDLKKIPVKQETIEVCEFFGLNPYEMLSGGALLMVTGDGAGLVSALEEAGISSAIIGHANCGNDKIVRNGEEIRYLGRPWQDEIFKIPYRE